MPFASPNGLFNLSKLSVWWLRLGIAIARIKPGHPQQNGRHERMHLTLKREATRPPGMNSRQQQARFDDFVQEFNTERPHEALAMKCPAEIYSASSRPYSGLPDLTYPLHDRDLLVTTCGRICMHRKRVNISTVLAGQRLGIKEVDDGIWIVSFMNDDLGFIDLEQKTLQPLDKLYEAESLVGVVPFDYGLDRRTGGRFKPLGVRSRCSSETAPRCFEVVVVEAMATAGAKVSVSAAHVIPWRRLECSPI